MQFVTFVEIDIHKIFEIIICLHESNAVNGVNQNHLCKVKLGKITEVSNIKKTYLLHTVRELNKLKCGITMKKKILYLQHLC